MPKTVTRKQEKFLRSKGTPLSKAELKRFEKERHLGKIRLKKGKKKNG